MRTLVAARLVAVAMDEEAKAAALKAAVGLAMEAEAMEVALMEAVGKAMVEKVVASTVQVMVEEEETAVVETAEVKTVVG
jgi:hypothetical protein